MDIKNLVLTKFNNVKFIGITGSESLLNITEARDVDVLVIIENYPSLYDKITITEEGITLDIFIRDYKYYKKLIRFEEPDPLHIMLVFYSFSKILYNDEVKFPDFKKNRDRLFDIIKSSLFNKGCNEEKKSTTILSKAFNTAYLAKVLIEGRNSLTENDRENLESIYSGNIRVIGELVSFYGLKLSSKITRVI